MLLAVGSSDPIANKAVEDLAELWASIKGAPVRAVFATTEPRALTALAEVWTTPPAIVPLFLAPGLLLDQVGRRAAELGLPVTEPLGVSMVQIVLARYDAILR